MKNSIVLKIVSYILICVLPILIVGNIAYMVILSENEQILEAETLYDTEAFCNMYISKIHDMMNDMNNVIIEESVGNGYTKYISVKIYNDLLDCVILDNTNKKIFGNIDIPLEDYSKEEIETFFINENEKYFIYENGVIRSNVDLLNNAEIYNINYIKDIDSIIFSKLDEDKSFDFYLLSSFFDLTKVFGRSPAILTPIFFIIFIACVIYVIVVAGNKKNHEGIYLSSFDKIPLDLITVIYFIIVIACCCLINDLGYISYNNETAFYTFWMTGAMIYTVLYLIVISWLITVVKRIKGKVFIKNNIITFCVITILKFLKWLLKKVINILSKLWNSFKNFIRNLYKYIGLNFRVLMLVFGFAILTTLFMNLSFDNEAFFLYIFILWGIALVYIVKKVARFKEIKNSLESIYNGDTNVQLDEDRYSNELKEISHYINDISGGFANAITQGVKSERMKAELITNVSHDIKTPLTSIINYVDLLKKEEIENEKAKEYIEILEVKSQRLKRLTEDLVEVSKASSGNIQLNMTKINLEELLNQSIGEFKDKFDEKKLEIIYNVKKEKINKVDRINKIEKIEHLENIGKISSIVKSENIYITADSKYMYRIIENLFSNIYKYALENSRVYIELESKDGNAIISIKNISKDKLNVSEEELMQRFVRGDKSRTTDGSGLGISIAKSLTELQKGTFELVIDGDLFKVNLSFIMSN